MIYAFIITALFVILFVWLNNYYIKTSDIPLTLLPDDDPKWKRIVRIEYDLKQRMLTIHTLDHNFRQFYHSTVEPKTRIIWKRFPSYKTIDDNELTGSLDHLYSMAILDGKRTREGWVKVFR